MCAKVDEDEHASFAIKLIVVMMGCTQWIIRSGSWLIFCLGVRLLEIYMFSESNVR